MPNCALTQGYAQVCRDSSGGVKRFYLIEFSTTPVFTIASGQITSISGAIGTPWKYEQELETAEFSEPIVPSRQNGTLFYTQDITMVLFKMQFALRNEIYLIAQNRLWIIVRDENDKYWWTGRQRGVMLDPSTAGTGKARGDRNGYELKFKGMESVPAEELSAGLVTSLGLT